MRIMNPVKSPMAGDHEVLTLKELCELLRHHPSTLNRPDPGNQRGALPLTSLKESGSRCCFRRPVKIQPTVNQRTSSAALTMVDKTKSLLIPLDRLVHPRQDYVGLRVGANDRAL